MSSFLRKISSAFSRLVSSNTRDNISERVVQEADVANDSSLSAINTEIDITESEIMPVLASDAGLDFDVYSEEIQFPTYLLSSVDDDFFASQFGALSLSQPDGSNVVSSDQRLSDARAQFNNSLCSELVDLRRLYRSLDFSRSQESLDDKILDFISRYSLDRFTTLGQRSGLFVSDPVLEARNPLFKEGKLSLPRILVGEIARVLVANFNRDELALFKETDSNVTTSSYVRLSRIIHDKLSTLSIPHALKEKIRLRLECEWIKNFNFIDDWCSTKHKYVVFAECIHCDAFCNYFYTKLIIAKIITNNSGNFECKVVRTVCASLDSILNTIGLHPDVNALELATLFDFINRWGSVITRYKDRSFDENVLQFNLSRCGSDTHRANVCIYEFNHRMKSLEEDYDSAMLEYSNFMHSIARRLGSGFIIPDVMNFVDLSITRYMCYPFSLSSLNGRLD